MFSMPSSNSPTTSDSSHATGPDHQRVLSDRSLTYLPDDTRGSPRDISRPHSASGSSSSPSSSAATSHIKSPRPIKKAFEEEHQHASKLQNLYMDEATETDALDSESLQPTSKLHDGNSAKTRRKPLMHAVNVMSQMLFPGIQRFTRWGRRMELSFWVPVFTILVLGAIHSALLVITVDLSATTSWGNTKILLSHGSLSGALLCFLVALGLIILRGRLNKKTRQTLLRGLYFGHQTNWLQRGMLGQV
jgi:hypothetical protein